MKARTSSISGLWFPWPIYMFFEMRFDLGTLDSGERSLPFGLLVKDAIVIRNYNEWNFMIIKETQIGFWRSFILCFE